MIECKRYTTEEFKQALNITKNSWESRKDDLMEHLRLYFDFEVVSDGRYIYYDVKEQLAEWEPLPRKKKSKEIKEYYRKETHEIVEKEPWNTGSNIARTIIRNDKNVYNHAETTIGGYVRPIIKEDFCICEGENRWCKIIDGSYRELAQEELEYLRKLFKDANNDFDVEKNLNLYAEYYSGYITKEELSKGLINDLGAIYGNVMQKFK